MTPDMQQKIDACRWFHSMDFGGGLRSVGTKSRACLAAEADAVFGPLDLAGKSVLDIGAWNGFFSFEAKRRGAARVVACDHYAWNDPELRGRETFDLARDLLGLDIEAWDIDIAELPAADFDVVLFLGVFYHLFDAPGLTRRVAACARDVLVLETMHDAVREKRPAMIFYPGAAHAGDPTNWWGPNHACVREILKECGFPRIRYTQTVKSRRHPRGVYHAFRA